MALKLLVRITESGDKYIIRNLAYKNILIGALTRAALYKIDGKEVRRGETFFEKDPDPEL